MRNRLGMSGSAIFSNPELYSELFIEGIDHIEIGEFPDEQAVNKFLEINKAKGLSFGIHSPLLRSGSKYDLLEKVKYEPSDAWNMLEVEAKRMKDLGAEYLLVHFPYFKDEVPFNAVEIIEEGLKKLYYIQEKYDIKMICEPKLGLNRSGAGIKSLQSFPIEIWGKYNIQMCMDIGDYIIAVGDEILDYLEKWKNFIVEAHLHNIYYEGNDYIWIPVHPSQEHDEHSHKVEHIIRFLAQCKDMTFIFEHTPETNPSKKFVGEGLKWVRKIII
ncbi:TIM barrel protein [Clostridium sp. UBA6640]|uniref:TIM barrel protein n=1 Tax=Clostridium sp. UBA6640 TaxID=1946370 RepID=UPI0025BC4861|nr:TIM barrel protein [Clostridium sp. UBA6640]